MGIKAIIKRPGEKPEMISIDNTLEALQALVGGNIETVTLAADFTVICNEEGRLNNMPYNCEVCGVDFVGTILFVGVRGEEFCDVPLTFDEFRRYFRNLLDEGGGVTYDK